MIKWKTDPKIRCFNSNEYSKSDHDFFYFESKYVSQDQWEQACLLLYPEVRKRQIYTKRKTKIYLEKWYMNDVARHTILFVFKI